jgi:hypothetical protein
MIRFLWFLLAALLFDTDDNDADDADADDTTDDDADDDKPDADGDEAITDVPTLQRKLKARKEQVGRLAKKLSNKDAEIKKLEKASGKNDSETVESLRVENAFLRTAITSGESLDLDTAWVLANSKGFMDAVKVKDDGTVEGMDTALEKLIVRIPTSATLT